MNDDARERIRRRVKELLEQAGDTRPFTDSESLSVSGRLDSLDVLQLVTFLEEDLSFSAADHGFVQDDFDSVDSIVAMIERAGSQVRA